MTSPSPECYEAFEVVGIELEYAVVDRDLAPRCLVEDLLHAIHGRPTSEATHKRVAFGNELAAHVIEVRNPQPQASLAAAECDLLEGVRYMSRLLREQFDARLLPTGMHPFMSPRDAALWRRAGRSIYETYANIFPIYSHGWLNVQSSHVNLPFGSEQDSVDLHNAAACLLPYLPALAASSPVFDGALGPAVDNRLIFYNTNQERIPEITGAVVPEYVESHTAYRKKIFAPIKRALASIPDSDRLQVEWTNSRGAIMRFSRRALEIKVLDVQECVKADIAIAAFIRCALRELVRRLRTGELKLPPHEMLVRDYHETVRFGSAAKVEAAHLRPLAKTGASRDESARVVLRALLGMASQWISVDERGYLALVEDRIERGNLSERIERAISQRMDAGSSTAQAIASIYGEMCDCLERNEPWDGGNQ